MEADHAEDMAAAQAAQEAQWAEDITEARWVEDICHHRQDVIAIMVIMADMAADV